MKLEELKNCFPAEDIEWRVQRSGKTGKGYWAVVLAYVTNRAIQQRLDDACRQPDEVEVPRSGLHAQDAARHDRENHQRHLHKEQLEGRGYIPHSIFGTQLQREARLLTGMDYRVCVPHHHPCQERATQEYGRRRKEMTGNWFLLGNQLFFTARHHDSHTAQTPVRNL